jgi:flagellar biosynthesis/type III secretory pathway M-ring protein FliF/YscJ
LALSAAVAAMGLVIGVLIALRARRRIVRPMRRRRRRGDSNDDDYVEPRYYAGVEMLEGKDENEHDDEIEEEQEDEEVEEQEQEQEEIMLNRNIV